MNSEDIEKARQAIETHFWGRTQAMVARLNECSSITYGENGRAYFQIPLIHRDTSINGGIYKSATRRNAISVNDTEDQVLFQYLVDFTNYIWGRGISRNEQAILEECYHFIQKTIRTGDPEFPYSHIFSEQIVPLGFYIIQRLGDCRVQALLACYLLEQLVLTSLLDAYISFDRNNYSGFAHAWCRVTLATTWTTFIIDPRRSFFGPLQRDNSDDSIWPYQRPEDYIG